MNDKKGFTLVELLAVIALLAFLAVLVMPNAFSSVREAKKNAFITEAKTVFQEATNKYTQERTEGNRINLVSNEDAGGTELKLNSEKDLKYTLRLDKKGNVTSYKIYNDEFCVAGTSSEVDDVSYENLIDFIEDPDSKECDAISSVEYNEKEKLTLNLKTKTTDKPVVSEANPSSIYLQYKVRWYSSDRKDASSIVSVIIPKKENFFFTGYSTNDIDVIDCKGKILLDNQGTGVFTDPSQTTADAYASYEKKYYMIEYKGNNATSGSMETKKYFYGTRYVLSENKYQRTGYTFSGWDGLGKVWNDRETLPEITDANEDSYSAFKFNTSAACNQYKNNLKTLTARWTANKYKVKLEPDYNGKTATISKREITVTYNGTYSELPIPSIYGYTFEGWYTSQTGGNIVKNTDTVKILNDITLYAHYKPVTYPITYSASGATNVPANGTKTHEVDYTISSQKPTKSNYIFNGWKDSDGALYNASGKYTKDKATTLTAQWCNNCNSISHGSCKLNASTPGTCTYDTGCEEGYTISNNGKYNAICTAITYPIKYSASGATNIPSNGTKTHGVDYTISSQKPTKSSYTFNGWKDSDGALYNASGKYTKNKSTTLTALWCNNCNSIPHGSCTLNASTPGTCTYDTHCEEGYTISNNGKYNATCTPKYDIAYSASGASNVPAKGTKAHGVDYTISSQKPTISGKTFNGWKDSDGALYNASGKYTKDKTTTLTAQWCTNCNSISHGSCTLNASTPGTCTYDTRCENGYTIKNSGTYYATCEEEIEPITIIDTPECEIYEVRANGRYKVELYGASGGGTKGGKGAYTKGTISLRTSDNVVICIGGAGSENTAGINGGGSSSAGGYGGGGATDMRIGTTNLVYGNNLDKRVMVAAGGGGAGFGDVVVYAGVGAQSRGTYGGNAGAPNGENGYNYTAYFNGGSFATCSAGLGATQSGSSRLSENSGGWLGSCSSTTSNGEGIGRLGFGGNAVPRSSDEGSGGGGGGYYGGSGGTPGFKSCTDDYGFEICLRYGVGGGGGGSSYINSSKFSDTQMSIRTDTGDGKAIITYLGN